MPIIGQNPIIHAKNNQYTMKKTILIVSGILLCLLTACNSSTKLKSFEKYNITKDRLHVYVNGKLMEGADPNTFELLGNCYEKDKNNVYYCGEIIVKGADSDTFEVMDYYAKDENHIYDDGEVIADADVKTFGRLSPVDEYLFKDKNNVYHYDCPGQGYFPCFFKKLENADPGTFETLSKIYAKDNKHIYYLGYPDGSGESGIIKDADPNTFQYLSETYAKDKNNVYYDYGYGVEIIEEADPSTFKVKTDGYSEDKNNKYFYSIYSGKVSKM